MLVFLVGFSCPFPNRQGKEGQGRVCTGDFAPPEPKFGAEFWETDFGRPNFGPEFFPKNLLRLFLTSEVIFNLLGLFLEPL